jgi:hypothetical protein
MIDQFLTSILHIFSRIFKCQAMSLLSFLPKIIESIIGKAIDSLPTLFQHRKLSFLKVDANYCYSHYEEQNHVRNGGTKKIYRAGLTITLYNPSSQQRILTALTLVLVVNGIPHAFRLFDLDKGAWIEDYNLPPRAVFYNTWIAAPHGHGIQPGEPGIIPLSSNDLVTCHLTYMDERGRVREVLCKNLERRRLNPDLIQP